MITDQSKRTAKAAPCSTEQQPKHIRREAGQLFHDKNGTRRNLEKISDFLFLGTACCLGAIVGSFLAVFMFLAVCVCA